LVGADLQICQVVEDVDVDGAQGVVGQLDVLQLRREPDEEKFKPLFVSLYSEIRCPISALSLVPFLSIS